MPGSSWGTETARGAARTAPKAATANPPSSEGLRRESARVPGHGGAGRVRSHPISTATRRTRSGADWGLVEAIPPAQRLPRWREARRASAFRMRAAPCSALAPLPAGPPASSPGGSPLRPAASRCGAPPGARAHTSCSGRARLGRVTHRWARLGGAARSLTGLAHVSAILSCSMRSMRSTRSARGGRTDPRVVAWHGHPTTC